MPTRNIKQTSTHQDSCHYLGISQLVQPTADEGLGRTPVHICEDAAIFVVGGKIAAAGPEAQVKRIAGPGQ